MTDTKEDQPVEGTQPAVTEDGACFLPDGRPLARREETRLIYLCMTCGDYKPRKDFMRTFHKPYDVAKQHNQICNICRAESKGQRSATNLAMQIAEHRVNEEVVFAKDKLQVRRQRRKKQVAVGGDEKSKTVQQIRLEKRKRKRRTAIGKTAEETKALRETAEKVARDQLRAEHIARVTSARAAADKRGKENAAQRELARRLLAREHLLPFVMRNKPDYKAGWVHKDICRRLEKFSDEVAAGLSPRLILMLPPRSGKSELASVQFPPWHMGRHPEHEIISTSHTASLANGFSRKVRGIMRTPAFKTVFPKTILDKDNQNTEGWLTTRGGGYVPAGVGGAIVGKGAHILVIDDPVKNAEEAESETAREAIWDWYTSVAYTRLAPGGGVIIIMQRWHDDDLSGRLERLMKQGEGDNWEIVRYPAIAEQDEKFRKKGEALHPERYDLEALEAIKRAVGPRVWAALYQQSPVMDEGSYFSPEMIRTYLPGELPQRLTYYSAWDLAISKNDRADWTVGLTVGVDEEDNIWLVDMRRDRMDSFEIVEAILDTYKLYPADMVGIEKSHVQMAIGPILEKRQAERNLYQMHIEELKPGNRDKELRARAIQGRARQGKVFFPLEAPWFLEMRSEMLAFPFGQHDDMVDALAWIGLMLSEMTAPRAPAPPRKKSWMDRVLKGATGPKNHMTS